MELKKIGIVVLLIGFALIFLSIVSIVPAVLPLGDIPISTTNLGILLAIAGILATILDYRK